MIGTSRRFDASAWVGPWPFGSGIDDTLPALIRSLRRADIGGAAVSPVRAILAPEPMTANADLLARVRSHRATDFRLAPVPILNPTLPGWEWHLALCLAAGEERVQAVKLVPNYHGYTLEEPAARACTAAIAAAGLTLCVQIRMLDERSHPPLMKVPGVDPAAIARLAGGFPELPVLACGAYQAELPALATATNVVAELSFVESGDTLSTALAVLPADRLLLGTHAPIHYPAPSVAKLAGDAPAAAVALIAAGNAARLFTG